MADISRGQRFEVVVHEGVTTSDGNVGGTTLIDSVLTQSNDYWKDLEVVIRSGNSIDQARRISGFTNATNTITVSAAFASQILSGTSYRILAIVTFPDVSVDVTAILNILTAHNTNGTYTHLNNLLEQDVLVFASATQDINLRLSMDNITQNTNIREYEKIDGITYDQLTNRIYPTDFDTNNKGIVLSFPQAGRLYKVTMQSQIVEGANKSVPYVYRLLSHA